MHGVVPTGCSSPESLDGRRKSALGRCGASKGAELLETAFGIGCACTDGLEVASKGTGRGRAGTLLSKYLFCVSAIEVVLL